MEDFEKMIERVIQSLGDRTVVSFKVVENQIDHVESGGIGIQNNHYHGVQPPHFAGGQPGYHSNEPCVPDGNGQHPYGGSQPPHSAGNHPTDDGNGPCVPDGNGPLPYDGNQPQITATVHQSLAKAQQVREQFVPRCSSQDDRLESEVEKNPEVTMNAEDRMNPEVRTIQPDPEFVVPSHIPPVLNTEKAWELWKRAKANGWVDRCLQPTLTDYQATILANVMAGLLELKVRWSPFEQFWGIKKMASKWVLSQGTNYYSDLYHEIKTRLSS